MPMSNAERQQRYRERKRQGNEGSTDAALPDVQSSRKPKYGGRRTKYSPRLRELFLATLRETGSVVKSAAAIATSKRAVYDWREEYPDFRQAWDEALADAVDALEREARRRAVDGIDKPVFYQGRQVDTIKEYSDRMLEMLLKAHMPDKYRENTRTEHTGTIGVVPIKVVEVVPLDAQVLPPNEETPSG